MCTIINRASLFIKTEKKNRKISFGTKLNKNKLRVYFFVLHDYYSAIFKSNFHEGLVNSRIVNLQNTISQIQQL